MSLAKLATFFGLSALLINIFKQSGRRQIQIIFFHHVFQMFFRLFEIATRCERLSETCAWLPDPMT
jgi:hypothetical protein